MTLRSLPDVRATLRQALQAVDRTRRWKRDSRARKTSIGAGQAGLKAQRDAAVKCCAGARHVKAPDSKLNLGIREQGLGTS